MKKVPRVLLVGAGRFGQYYIRHLQDLASAGQVSFAGVCVKHLERAAQLATTLSVPVYTEITDDLLRSVDAVCIVTPPETHTALIERCLPFTNVFVEKPLALSSEELRRISLIEKASSKILVVGHLFRFHPVTMALVELVQGKERPRFLHGVFINPAATDQGRDAAFELLHWFDVVDYLWPEMHPTRFYRSDVKRMADITLRYGSNTSAHFELGWQGERRQRSLTLRYLDQTVTADYLGGTVTVAKNGEEERVLILKEDDVLKNELQTFLSVIMGIDENPVPYDIGARVVKIAESVRERTIAVEGSRKLRTAVIGGGVFGTNSACALSDFSDVVLFEQHSEILMEGGRANCFRHHAGYHYPRSDATVRDVQQAARAFEALYSDALVSDVPGFYGIPKEGSQVTPEEFLVFCERHNLPCEPAVVEWFSSSTIEFAVMASESIYHYETLKKLIQERLVAARVDVRLSTPVLRVALASDGKKLVTYLKEGVEVTEIFDVLVNATYASINRFIEGIEGVVVPIRVDWAEVAVVHLDMPPVALTVIDGPFSCVLPTGNPNEFTVYHVVESVHERYTPESGMVHQVAAPRSNALAIIEKSTPYFPFLSRAILKESRYVHRGVPANHEHDDNRVAELYSHGFDCYSILSGKIICSVQIANQLAEQLRQRYGGGIAVSTNACVSKEIAQQ